MDWVRTMKSFLSFRGSRAGLFSDLSMGEFCPRPIPFDRPFDFTQGHEQRRMAQGCGFPHRQVAKRTAPSHQSIQKRLYGPDHQQRAFSVSNWYRSKVLAWTLLHLKGPRFRPWPFFSLRPSSLRLYSGSPTGQAWLGAFIRMWSLSLSERASPKEIPQNHTLV